MSKGAPASMSKVLLTEAAIAPGPLGSNHIRSYPVLIAIQFERHLILKRHRPPPAFGICRRLLHLYPADFYLLTV